MKEEERTQARFLMGWLYTFVRLRADFCCMAASLRAAEEKRCSPSIQSFESDTWLITSYGRRLEMDFWPVACNEQEHRIKDRDCWGGICGCVYWLSVFTQKHLSQKMASTTRWTVWFFHQHQPALLSATLMPEGTQGSRNLGAVTTTGLLWVSQVSQAAGKERNYCIRGAFSPDQHTSRISSCSALSHWPDPRLGEGRLFTPDLIERYK